MKTDMNTWTSKNGNALSQGRKTLSTIIMIIKPPNFHASTTRKAMFCESNHSCHNSR